MYDRMQRPLSVRSLRRRRSLSSERFIPVGDAGHDPEKAEGQSHGDQVLYCCPH
jgi:hypothetical protein